MDNRKLTLDINHHSKIVTLDYRLYYPNGDCQHHNFNDIFSLLYGDFDGLTQLLSAGDIFNFCQGYLYGLPDDFVTMPGPMSRHRAFLIPSDVVPQFAKNMFGQNISHYRGVPDNYQLFID